MVGFLVGIEFWAGSRSYRKAYTGGFGKKKGEVDLILRSPCYSWRVWRRRRKAHRKRGRERGPLELTPIGEWDPPRWNPTMGGLLMGLLVGPIHRKWAVDGILMGNSIGIGSRTQTRTAAASLQVQGFEESRRLGDGDGDCEGPAFQPSRPRLRPPPQPRSPLQLRLRRRRRPLRALLRVRRPLRRIPSSLASVSSALFAGVHALAADVHGSHLSVSLAWKGPSPIPIRWVPPGQTGGNNQALLQSRAFHLGRGLRLACPEG
ncbi:hypothetical protein Taro_045966 [Colocasia esculenta]|uniref:Uncharacterized protein n=1 Tax=Colocasia esculenta TaxID=4460 RepID=A0A843WY92_COLES|nr:hypothetical protein [Colocasia esculenta]